MYVSLTSVLIEDYLYLINICQLNWFYCLSNYLWL